MAEQGVAGLSPYTTMGDQDDRRRSTEVRWTANPVPDLATPRQVRENAVLIANLVELPAEQV